MPPPYGGGGIITHLCVKLVSFGIAGNLLQWISSFLHDTIGLHSTKLGNCQSSLSKVTDEVPWGSVLDPLLFLLFINDLPSLCDDGVAVKTFADDVKVYLVVYDINNSPERQQQQVKKAPNILRGQNRHVKQEISELEF